MPPDNAVPNNLIIPATDMHLGEVESRLTQVLARQPDLASSDDVKEAIKEAKRYRDVSWFRQYGTAPVEAWYMAGLVSSGGLSDDTSGLFDANRLYAVPFYTGKGGKIDGAAFRVVSGHAATRVARIGLYSNTSDSELYPFQLVQDFGEQDCSTASVKSTAATCVLPEDSIMWAVYVKNHGSVAIRTIIRDDLYPCYGIDSAFGTNPGHGITVAFTYAALPQNFPGGGAINTDAEVPAIGFRMYG
jgi:hypothetical protein